MKVLRFFRTGPTIILITILTFLLLIIAGYLITNDSHVRNIKMASLVQSFDSNLHEVEITVMPEGDIQQLNIMFLFNDAGGNIQLQNSFTTCITSLLVKASRTKPLHFYITGDFESFLIAKNLISKINHDAGTHHQILVNYQNYSLLQVANYNIILQVHKQLSSGKDHQFSSPLFYLSILLHKIMPVNLYKMIVLDVDLVINSDINQLFALFDKFDTEQAIGIAHENQPVYQNVFWEYRKNNPGTRVAEPPPFGLSGFNSGVVLFDLNKLRQSTKYSAYLTESNLISLVKKYHFRGHLGDQDFFTLLSFEHEELFYVLPCGWNRQLCTWWKNNGFSDIFDLFFNCSGPVHIWHGNCKTSLLNYTLH